MLSSEPTIPEGLVQAGVVAREHGVTPTTIGNWRRSGMPSRHTDDRGWHYYDPDEVRQWKRANIGEEPRGGRRENAGRPREAGRHEERDAFAQMVEEAREAHAIIAREAPPENAFERGDLLKCTPEELRWLAARGDDVGLTKAQTDRWKNLTEIVRTQDAIRRQRGELVEVSEVEAAQVEQLSGFRRALERMVLSLTPRVIAACGASPDRTGAVREEIDRAVTDALAELAG